MTIRFQMMVHIIYLNRTDDKYDDDESENKVMGLFIYLNANKVYIYMNYEQ
jgi:hypothetical protein